MDIKKINTPTNRVTDKNINNSFAAAPISPNCGLSCYLGEAFMKAEITEDIKDPTTREVIDAIMYESQEYDRFNNKLFWGWEKTPTIQGVNFPFDWDDTAKALDLLHIADVHSKSGSVDFNQQIPNDSEIKILFEESLFIRKEIGEDKKISCPFHTAFFVFFGPGSEIMDKRDDPMVTVAILRMLAKWYPNVAKKNKKNIKALLKRAIYTLNYLLINETEKFEYFSRYYFSLGHFAYRLIETINYLDEIGIKIQFNSLKLSFKYQLVIQKIDSNRIKKQVEYSKSKLINESNNNECFWWYLIGLKLKLISLQVDFKDKILNNCNDRIIYQHRRLNHQYFAKDWEKKLLLYELEIHNNNIKKIKRKSQMPIFHKKTLTPIFAIAAFFIFVISLSANNDFIINEIINKTNVFKLNGESSINLYPYAKNILYAIFLFFGIRLYIQAWAIEETFFIDRIRKPIKNSLSRYTFSFFDILFRLIWTLLVMAFPIYFGLKNQPIETSWSWYIVFIYIFILFWDCVVVIPFYNYYKNDKEKLKSTLKNWFSIDFLLLILVNLSAISITSDLKGWSPIIFIILWGLIFSFSIVQICVFGKFIISSKIYYKFD